MSSTAHPSASAATCELDWLDRALFCVLLAVLSARPMIGESFERLDLSFLAALPDAGGPTPATTALLDSIVLATAVLVLVRRGRWRRSGLWLFGGTLLAAAVGVSSAAAGDKALALFAGASLFIGVLAGLALAALLRRRWMRHLLIAALLATGCTTAVRCIVQRFVEFPDLARSWEAEQKPQLMKLGYEPDDPLLVNFERRMRAREADGFLAHPNITGSCLMMWALVLCGVLAGTVVQRGEASAAPQRGTAPEIDVRRIAPTAAALMGVLLIFALALTRSRGAVGAGLFGLVALVLLGRSARWATQHSRVLLMLLVAGYVALIGGVAAYGIAKGTLPQASLAFRWYYWTAGVRAYAEVPLTGLGRGNFAAAYMRQKVAESTEEVRDPHDLWVSLLVELGPLGLAAGVVLAVLVLRAALRGLCPAAAQQAVPDVVTLARAAPVAGIVLLTQALLSGTQLAHPGMPLIWGTETAATWLGTYALSAWLLNRAAAKRQSEAWVAAGLCAAVLASFVHSLVDFALLTPGGLAAFVLCAAGAGGLRRDAEGAAPLRPWQRRIGVGLSALAGVVLVAGHALLITRPIVATTEALAQMDAALQALADPGGRDAARTGAALVIAQRGGDPWAARAAARALLQVGRSRGTSSVAQCADLQQALEYARQAVLRNPNDTNTYALRGTIQEELARLYEREGQTDQARQARRAAAEDWQHAVALYPTNPRTRISAGEAWLQVWRRDDVFAAAGAAQGDFSAALAIDDCRPPQEVVRLRPQERAALKAALHELPQENGAPAP